MVSSPSALIRRAPDASTLTMSGQSALSRRRGCALEYATLAWKVAGLVILAIAAISAWSVALAGFALDSLNEIGASTDRLDTAADEASKSKTSPDETPPSSADEVSGL